MFHDANREPRPGSPGEPTSLCLGVKACGKPICESDRVVLARLRLRPSSVEEWVRLASHGVSLPRFAGRDIS